MKVLHTSKHSEEECIVLAISKKDIPRLVGTHVHTTYIEDYLEECKDFFEKKIISELMGLREMAKEKKVVIEAIEKLKKRLEFLMEVENG